jgi:hypothetical protein
MKRLIEKKIEIEKEIREPPEEMDAHVNYHGQRFDISVPPGGEERARERLLQHAVTEPIAKVSLQTERKIVASLRPVSMLAWSFSNEQMAQRESELALWKNRRGNGRAPPPPLTHKAHSNHYFLPTITSSLPSTVYVDAAGKKVGGVFTKGAKTYIFDKGKLQAKYAHHDLHLPFSISLVHNWNNLLISLGIEGPGIGYGGLNTILATMGQKQRPYLVISFHDEEEFHLHAAIADATGLPYTRARTDCSQGDAPSTFVLTMCQKGTLAENFNLELLLQSYEEASSKIGCKILSANEIVFLRSLTDTNLSEFLRGIFPPTSGGRALFGLLMGHPLEATISDIVSAKPK